MNRPSRGDMVFRFGEPCESFPVMDRGHVKRLPLSPAGHEKVIEIVSPGQRCAEALMSSGRACFLRAQALADALVVSIGKEAVLAEVGRDPRFTLRMRAAISRRLLGRVRNEQAHALEGGSSARSAACCAIRRARTAAVGAPSRSRCRWARRRSPRASR
jgi:CRP/FNR family transcriptional regulator, dissimilatory nitrate respiration regulator